jgi:excinuclease ABC subunit C
VRGGIEVEVARLRRLETPARTLLFLVLREKPDLNARLHDVPHQPGVYLMRDRLNRVIYVGKAKDLRKRLSNYFQPARSRMADLKTRALIKSIWEFEFHVVRNEPESLLLEGKLIKEYRPKYNISFRDDKRFLLLKVHPEEPWPRFFLTRTKKDDGARYFGPFAHSGSLRATLHWMQRQFGLRSCRPVQPGEQEYRHCHNDVIKNCCAPCIGRVTRTAYLTKVEEACQFLDGKAKEHLREIEQEMLAAADELDFERAADLRDMLTDFKKTLTPTRAFQRGRGTPGANIKPTEDIAELAEYLQLGKPLAVMECFDISNISSNHIVASMVRFQNGVPDTANYRRYRIRTVTQQNDFASMAEVVRRRYQRILLDSRTQLGPDDADADQDDVVSALRRIPSDTPRYVRLPDLVIVDGGKGQLSSACTELQRLGLSALPIIGLAKEREEVFFPGESEPLLIPHATGALRLLQRIRDEAHRWANGYHQLLMKRRIAESLLDDIPGVSETRKLALLKEFGSVARLRRLTPDTIARVPGISKTLATEIRAWLDVH